MDVQNAALQYTA